MNVEEGRANYLATVVKRDNWPVMTIEEIADLNPRIDKAEIPDDLPVSFVPMPAVGAGDGSICIDNTRSAAEVKKGFTAFLEGDVLFAKITPCMENGKMAVVPKLVNGFGFGSTEFHVLRPKHGIDAKYLYYYVSSQTFRGEAERHMTGAVGQRRVPTTYLRECKIPVAPLDQQKHIVAEIEKQFSRLDEAIANLKRVKANLKRYKAAVLNAAVEGRLVETEAELARREGRSYETGEQLLQRILETRRSQWRGKGKYKEPAAPDTTSLPELPEGWVWAVLELVADLVDPHPSHRTPPEDIEGIPYIGMGDISAEGRFDFEESRKVSKSILNEHKNRYQLRTGDFIFGKIGTIGQPVLLPEPFEYSLSANVILVQPDNRWLHPKLAFVYLMSSVAESFVSRESRATTQAAFGIKKMRVVPTPVPPLPEQIRIVAEIERRLSVLRETEAQVDNNLKRAEQLRQSFLSKVFSGASTTLTEI